jgi:VCBS repeat-containing protein
VPAGQETEFSLTENDANLTTNGKLIFADVDVKDTVNVVVSDASVIGLMNGESVETLKSWITLTDAKVSNSVTDTTLNWVFNAPSLDYLDNGDEITLTYTLTATDASGSTVDQSIVIVITGTEDDPVLSGTLSGSVTEDVTVTASGRLEVTDLDADAVFSFVPVNRNGKYGSFILTSSGLWTYKLDNDSAGVQALGDTDHLVETFAVSDANGNTSTVQITVHGKNDIPIATVKNLAAVEDGDQVKGTVLVDDKDQDATRTYTITQPSEGSVAIDAVGQYTFDPGPDFQDLSDGETRQVSFDITVTDDTNLSTIKTITVTVVGVNDAPIALNDTAIISPEGEQVGPIAVLLNDSDAEADTLTVIEASASHGTVLVVGNKLKYIPTIGYVGSDTISYTISDGNDGTATAEIAVTLTSSNSAPTLAVGEHDKDNATLTETDAPLSASGRLSLKDVDLTDTVRTRIVGLQTAGETLGIAAEDMLSWFTIDGQLSRAETSKPLIWQFNSPGLNALEVDDTLTLTYQIEATDGAATSTHDVVIAIQGSNDGPEVETNGYVLNKRFGDQTYDLLSLAAPRDAEGTLNFFIESDPAITATDGKGNSKTLPPEALVIGADGVATLNMEALDLAEGESRHIVVSYMVSDGFDSTATQLTIDVGYSRPAFYDIVASRSTKGNFVLGALGAMDREGQSIAPEADGSWRDLDGEELRFGADAADLVFGEDGLPNQRFVNLINNSGAQLALDTKTGEYRYLAGAAPADVETFRIWVSDGTDKDDLYLVFTASDTDDRDGISSAAERALARLKGLEELGDDRQDIATFAWKKREIFTAGLNYTDAVDQTPPDATSIIRMQAIDANGNANILVQLSGLEVLSTNSADAGSIEAAKKVGETPITTAWDPLHFRLEAITSLGFQDIDTSRDGVQVAVSFDFSSSKMTRADVNGYMKYVTAETIASYAAEGLPLNDLEGEKIAAEGWYDFTAKVDEEGNRISDGAMFNFVTTDGVDYLDTMVVIFTDNAFGDNDVTKDRIEDPGTVGYRQDVFAEDNAASVTEDSTVSGNLITDAWDNPNDAPDQGALVDRNEGDGSLKLNAITAGGSLTSVEFEQTISGSHGNLTVKEDGSFSYVPSQTAQQLLYGDKLTDTFTYRITNGVGTDTAELTVTISGVTDAPVFSIDPGDTATKSLTESNAVLSTSGVISISDIEVQDVVTVQVHSVSAEGHLNGVALADVKDWLSISGGVADNNTSADISWSFIPDAAFDYLDAGDVLTLTYTLEAADTGGANATQNVVVTITGTNDNPVIIAYDMTLTEDDAAVNKTAVVTDADFDDTRNFSISVAPSEGVASVDASTGEVTFAPNGAFDDLAFGKSRDVSFDVRVTDSAGGASDQTVVVTVTGVNDVPVAADDDTILVRTNESSDPVDVLANDSDIDGDLLTVTEASAFNGTVEINGENQLIYKGNHNFAGPDTISYTISDGNGGQDTASVNVTVFSNDAPAISIGFDDSAEKSLDETNAQLSATGSLTLSDINPTNTVVMSVTAVSSVGDLNSFDEATVLGWLNVSGGVANGKTEGVATWTFNSPSLDYLNDGDQLEITYIVTATDDFEDTAEQTVKITIKGTNDAPTLEAKQVILNETDATLSSKGKLSITDADDGESVYVSQTDTQGTYGTFSIETDGAWIFTANSDWNALKEGEQITDIFGVLSADGMSTTVEITIKGTNDAPTLSVLAVDLTEDAVGSAASQVNDPDRDASFTYSVVRQPSQGLVTIDADGKYTFDPNGKFNDLNVGDTATETFDVRVVDEHGSGETVTVTATITGLNDAPTLSVVAVDLTEDAVGSAESQVNDPDRDASFTYSVVRQPTQGLVTIDADGKYTFDPNGKFNDLNVGDTATETFDVRVVDEHGSGETVTVTATITGLNDAPTLETEQVILNETDATLSSKGKLSITDADDGESVYVSQTDTQGTYGTFSIETDGAWIFTANSDWNALKEGEQITDIFGVLSADGTSTTVEITIKGTNDAPTLSVLAVDLTEDAVGSAASQVNDPDRGASFTYSVVRQPSQGLVTIDADGKYTFDPNGKFNDLNVGDTATETFDVRVVDEHGSGETVTVTATITGLNDAPTLSAVAVDLTEDAVGSAESQVNDPDRDASFTYSVVRQPTQGLVTIDADGKYTFDPNGKFNDLNVGDTATETFDVRVVDEHGSGETVTVTATITGLNDAPTLSVVAVDLTEDAVGSAESQVNDPDRDASFTYSVVRQPTQGLVTIDADGKYTFDPNGKFNDLNVGDTATETFDVRVVDEHGSGETVTVTATITGLNDAPTLSVVAVDLTEDAVGSAASQVNDPDRDASFTYSVVRQPTQGLVTIDADGKYTFDPNGKFNDLNVGDTATETFDVRVVDEHGSGETVTVTATITGLNDAPTLSVVAVDLTEDAVGSAASQVNDPDRDASFTYSVVRQPTQGLVTIDAVGKYTFDPNGKFNDLNVGDTATETFDVRVVDEHGSGETVTVTATITGLNDAPTDLIIENLSSKVGGQAVSGNAVAKDVDRK